MEPNTISLLYPEGKRTESDVRIPEEVCRQLGLANILSLHTASLSDFFTGDPEVIAYRQGTFSDLARLPALSDTLEALLPTLTDIEELRRLDRDRGENAGESYLYAITEIELYVSCIDTLAGGLLPVSEQLRSPAFRQLAAYVRELTEGAYYRDLNRKLRDLSAHVHEVRSVTIGVNLDAQYRPTEAGVLSVNSDPVKGGTALDRILRLSFRPDAATCIAPLTPMGGRSSDTRREALVGAFRDALEDVFRSSVRGWRSIIAGYVLENTDFILRLLPEIEFVTRAAALLRRLREKGLPVTAPTILPAADKAFDVRGLYNPDVALRTEGAIVPNDLTFDDAGRIFVLTGPNRGGKSVVTCAVGIAQAMAQLGLDVPAESAVISVTDAIRVHFPEGAEDTLNKGRLGEECARMRDIFREITPDSLILLDESLSSTGAYEASYIAAEILTGFAVCGCRGIFSTHLHDLAAAVPDINARSLAEGGVAVDTLVAGMAGGERSFRILRAKPDGRSYARDIADRYGLSLDEIRRQIRRSAPAPHNETEQ